MHENTPYFLIFPPPYGHPNWRHYQLETIPTVEGSCFSTWGQQAWVIFLNQTKILSILLVLCFIFTTFRFADLQNKKLDLQIRCQWKDLREIIWKKVLSHVEIMFWLRGNILISTLSCFSFNTRLTTFNILCYLTDYRDLLVHSLLVNLPFYTLGVS